jgi:hypothetical protein
MPAKIIGIGLWKTGTLTLNDALGILGYNACHWDWWYPLNGVDALTDITASIRYRELDYLFPDSKFILTMRDEESWLKSMERHTFLERGQKLRHPHPGQSDWRAEAGWTFVRAYGQLDFERHLFLAKYREHNFEAQRYFGDRPNDLLIINICAGEGWEKLCPFLKKPVPEVPFPWSNRSQH